jgi:hypothetical protein
MRTSLNIARDDRETEEVSRSMRPRALIEDDFKQPHSGEFDHRYMVMLFEYGRAQVGAGT